MTAATRCLRSKLIALCLLLVNAITGASSEPVLVPDFAAELLDGRAYRDASPDVQDALCRIAELASEYAGLSERDLLALPGLQRTGERAAGNMLDFEYARPDGARIECNYNRTSIFLSGVTAIYPDESAVSVSFSRRVKPPQVLLHAGYVVYPGGEQALEFGFHELTILPRQAVPFVGKRPHVKVKGTVVAWDPEGNVILTREYAEPKPAQEVLYELMATASPQQLDAFGVSAEERLMAMPAYRDAEPEVQRSFEILAGWSERFVGARPEDLPAALVKETVERIGDANTIAYRVTSASESERDWIVEYDDAGSMVKRASWSGLTLFFDDRDGAVPIGGIRERNTEEGKRIWVLSVYPGRYAPRIAISASGEQPDGPLEDGSIQVWGPDGQLLVKRDFTSSVADLMAALDAELNAEQKAALDWRDGMEAAYLLGRY